MLAGITLLKKDLRKLNRFFFRLESKLDSGDGFVFIFNKGEWSSAALSTDRLRQPPSVSVVSLEVETM